MHKIYSSLKEIFIYRFVAYGSSSHSGYGYGYACGTCYGDGKGDGYDAFDSGDGSYYYYGCGSGYADGNGKTKGKDLVF